MSAAALLYRPTPRWQFWAAFVGATLLHLGAIAIAANRPISPPPAVTGSDGVEIIVVPEQADQLSPTDGVEAPPPSVTPQVSDDAFVADVSATPPPVRRIERQAQLIRRPPASPPAGPTSMHAAKVLAISAQRPEYPYQARRQRVTGSGVALLTVDARGHVIDVTMLRSTGSGILDQATISGFRRWRFRPGTVSRVQTPITYTLTGASY
ncbi:MAG: TonB family protein [Chthoniobacterales bacterium]|nr:TonB family protein [Chthoniobacterales bacterium]